MHTLYIDTHTHNQQNDHTSFQLHNVIVGRDSFLTPPCSVGIHPRHIDTDIDAQFAILENYANHKNVLAIGECGLDKLCETDWSIQTDLFQRQITLAEKTKKPLIIHCVRAYQEIQQLLNKTTQPTVFHGFNKKIELARQLLKQGHYISLGTDILRGHMDAHLRELPLDKIFLETDGKPISIIDIYTYFCGVRKITTEQLQEQMVRNFEKVFMHIIK